MLQNATPLRKSAPWPPNISDEHVSCSAPATKMHLCRSSSNAPRLPSFLEMLQNRYVLLTFGKVHNPLHLPRETTSERPKVVRACGIFNILTSKCASRHNGVHFFDISTSKSAPYPLVFYTFDFEMCFAPQRRALFDIATSKSGPKLVCFVHFDFEMCFAPQRRALFSTSQLLQVIRSWGVLCILTWKCASRHNGVQCFISHLASWLRTRRFSEPTFRPSGATNHRKNTVFRDFPTFSRTWIFFLLRLSLSSLLFSDSSQPCFLSVHIVGSLSLTSKLPSNMAHGSPSLSLSLPLFFCLQNHEPAPW